MIEFVVFCMRYHGIVKNVPHGTDLDFSDFTNVSGSGFKFPVYRNYWPYIMNVRQIGHYTSDMSNGFSALIPYASIFGGVRGGASNNGMADILGYEPRHTMFDSRWDPA